MDHRQICIWEDIVRLSLVNSLKLVSTIVSVTVSVIVSAMVSVMVSVIVHLVFSLIVSLEWAFLRGWKRNHIASSFVGVVEVVIP
jgi:hypothetical protein